MKVGISEPKGREHRGNVRGRIGGGCWWHRHRIASGRQRPKTLPECCLGLDVGEQRPYNQGENGVEIGPGGLNTRAYVELVDGEPGYRGPGYGPGYRGPGYGPGYAEGYWTRGYPVGSPYYGAPIYTMVSSRCRAAQSVVNNYYRDRNTGHPAAAADLLARNQWAFHSGCR